MSGGFEPVFEPNGELEFRHGPFPGRHSPLFLGEVQHQIEQLHCRLVVQEWSRARTVRRNLAFRLSIALVTGMRVPAPASGRDPRDPGVWRDHLGQRRREHVVRAGPCTRKRLDCATRAIAGGLERRKGGARCTNPESSCRSTLARQRDRRIVYVVRRFNTRRDDLSVVFVHHGLKMRLEHQNRSKLLACWQIRQHPDRPNLLSQCRFLCARESRRRTNPFEHSTRSANLAAWRRFQDGQGLSAADAGSRAPRRTEMRSRRRQ